MVVGMAREGARYKIGPLTTYAEASELRQWLLVATAGEEMVYAIGPGLSLGAETPKLARALADRGEALLLQRREGKGLHYIIRKREPREASGAADPTTMLAWDGKPEGRVLQAVVELSDFGLPLPLYDDLAEACGLADGEAVRYRLGVLEKAGAIRLLGVTGARVVEVCSTGQRTAAVTRRGAGR